MPKSTKKEIILWVVFLISLYYSTSIVLPKQDIISQQTKEVEVVIEDVKVEEFELSLTEEKLEVMSAERNVNEKTTPVIRTREIIVEEEEEVKKDYYEIKLELTFYTSLASCNGNNHQLTASGKKLNPLSLAVPRKVGSTRPSIPFHTKVYIEGYGEKIVEDTGNPKYLFIKNDGTYIVDVYIPRNSGENDNTYLKRVRNMGRIQTTAKVYYEK